MHKKNFHVRCVHVHNAGVGEKEADSFTPAHRKKHNELSTHTVVVYTHTNTQQRQVGSRITGYNERSAS